MRIFWRIGRWLFTPRYVMIDEAFSGALRERGDEVSTWEEPNRAMRPASPIARWKARVWRRRLARLAKKNYRGVVVPEALRDLPESPLMIVPNDMIEFMQRPRGEIKPNAGDRWYAEAPRVVQFPINFKDPTKG